MTGEIRDERRFTTAEIANPATARAQYQNRGSHTTTEVIHQPGNVEMNRDTETRRDTAATGMAGDLVQDTIRDTRDVQETRDIQETRDVETRDIQGTRDVVPDQKLQNDQPGQLFPDNELNQLRARWDKAQILFVDEPRAAVEQADNLVATVVKRIAEQFAAERADLEHQWDRGDNVSTEDLRQALRRYRGFFDRLLAF
jgi:hypothetical protein